MIIKSKRLLEKHFAEPEKLQPVEVKKPIEQKPIDSKVIESLVAQNKALVEMLSQPKPVNLVANVTRDKDGKMQQIHITSVF